MDGMVALCLKRHTTERCRGRQQELVIIMYTLISPFQMLNYSMSVAHCMPGCMYLVGGAVRDSVLGLTPHDEDYIVIGDFDAVKKQVLSIGSIVHADARYGLVRGKVNGCVHDFVMARRDGMYHDRRHCSVQPGSLLDDLARRDFTVNAVAVDACDFTVVDPFNGMQDLQQRTLRCVGNTRDRLSEDPLRMVRALRFIVTRNLQPDAELQACMLQSDVVSTVQHISKDRIRQELNKCLEHDTEFTLCRLVLQYRELMRVLLTKVTLKFCT